MHRNLSHDQHNPEIERRNNRNTEQWDQNSQAWQNHQNHPLDLRNQNGGGQWNTGNRQNQMNYQGQQGNTSHNRSRATLGYQDPGYGHAGNPRNGDDYGRKQSDAGTGATYGASRNYGSMGSYGGAQGFGTASGGNNLGYSGSGFNSDSGRADRNNYEPVHHKVYGAYRDHNSFAPGEKESYDGSARYGSQGADNSRRRLNRNEELPRTDYGTNRSNRLSEDDSRYEIYDSARSQYNRGEYGNPSRGSVTHGFHQNTNENYDTGHDYGSRNRASNRQGDGNDQDQQFTSGFYQGNFSDYDNENLNNNRNSNNRQSRYYDRTGDAWNPGAERNM